MDFLPISVCYAAMLVKVAHCWSDSKDISKNQVLTHHASETPGRKWRSGNVTVVNMHQNRSRGKFKKQEVPSNVKLSRVYNMTELITTEILPPTKSNDSNSSSSRKETSTQKLVIRPLLHRINATLTRSKDAVWATISLTFICIVLLLAVAHSRMWKDYNGSEMHHGIPRPNFNERVPFKEVLDHKMTLLKEFIKRKKNTKRSPLVELESLLHDDDDEN